MNDKEKLSRVIYLMRDMKRGQGIWLYPDYWYAIDKVLRIVVPDWLDEWNNKFPSQRTEESME